MNVIKKLFVGTVLMTLALGAQAAEAQWADEREIAIDTRERIIFATPAEVLPVAYSTNGWGWAKFPSVDPGNHIAIAQLHVNGENLPTGNANGYAEWVPEVGAYGAYDIKQSWIFDGTICNSTNVTVYYSQPYQVAVTGSTECGMVTVMANTADVEAGTVLGFDFVDIVAEPTDAKWAFKTWSVSTNGVAVNDILTKDVTVITNRFEMPMCDTALTAEFVISEAYRAELAAAATNDYVTATNNIEQLRMNRLSDAETDAALAAALDCLNTTAGTIAGATKPSEAEAATNVLATALAEVEEDAAKKSDTKPHEFVIAADFERDVPFEEYDVETGVFKWNGQAWTNGVNAFTSFAAAFANESYGAFATKLNVFGNQTLDQKPPMVDTWNLNLIATEDETGNEVLPIVTVGTVGSEPSELVDITEKLGQIAGKGEIILGKTSDNVDPSIYDSYFADGANVGVVNVGAELVKDGDDVKVEVSDQSRPTTDDQGRTAVLLGGVQNQSGDIALDVKAQAPSDVVVAGDLEAIAGEVKISNYSTNKLEIAGTVRAKKVTVENFGRTAEVEGAIYAKRIVASGDVDIYNNAHLEATVTAEGRVRIFNGSPTTLVGDYTGKTIELVGSLDAAISNVTLSAEEAVQLSGYNVLTGPLEIEAPEGMINCSGDFAWDLRGGNQTAKLCNFDKIAFGSTEFSVLTEVEQAIGCYVLADNAASLADASFSIQGFAEGAKSFEVALGQGLVANAEGNRLYRLDLNEEDELVLTVIDTRTFFEQAEYSVLEGGALKVKVHGGSFEHAVQASLSYVKNSGAFSAAFMDGKRVSFPLTLQWTKGEIGAKEIIFQTSASSRTEEDKFFTLQLSAAVGEEVLSGMDICTVTIQDAQGGVESKPYVRALAWPANAGSVSGGGVLATDKSALTLTATAKSYATFAGWYRAQADNSELIDLSAPVEPYRASDPKRIRVGYGTENEAGTYFAYFTNVLEVATVVEPQAIDAETGKPLAGVAGVLAQDAANGVYKTVVGVKFRLPVEFVEGSGKGKFTAANLPTGLSLKLDKLTGVYAVEGVPTKAGVFQSTFTASNAAGKHALTFEFEVAAMPANAIGTFAGVVEDDEDCTGIGSVSFTAGKTGALSAKVTRRLSGARSFSVKGYDLVDANTFAVAMTNNYGEVFEAMLPLTNEVFGTILSGRAFGGEKKGTLGYNGETNGVFTAVRNVFATADKNFEAQQWLEFYRGTYQANIYAIDEDGRLDATKQLGTVQYRVGSGGNVYVAAKLFTATTPRTFSGTVAGALRVDPEISIAQCEVALRGNAAIWSTLVTLDPANRTVKGDARYLREEDVLEESFEQSVLDLTPGKALTKSVRRLFDTNQRVISALDE